MGLKVRNKTIIGLKYAHISIIDEVDFRVRNKTIIGLKYGRIH